ncbi:indolepyruvate ferredoxin oxidoreductase family protein [Terrarubrum flagellatum]|uniref:indolepyruvate ferredoxin oxidoreductase family protein n=1 Tax=Terrirubrum flagellatum TaxID=2895980 RepID=UPI0031454DB5
MSERGPVLLSGVQALVRLALLQRQRDARQGLNTAGFISGYRGSPLAGLDRELARAKRHLDAHHIVFKPGLNEDLAATAIWGTQQTGLFPGARYDGVFSMWYGKGPGVDRSMDAIRHANAFGTSRQGGALLMLGDDHGAVSSTFPHQSEHNLASAMVPVLSPAGLGEFLDLGLLGWAMSRHSGAWVGFKCQTEIVECTTTFDVDPDRLTIIEPSTENGSDNLWIRWPDRALAMEERLIERKMRAVAAFARANKLDRVTLDSRRARIGIAASGKAWLDLQAALAMLGVDAARAEALGLRLYKIGMVWPLEAEGLIEFADGLEEILVVEEKRPVIEEQIKSLLFNAPADRRPRVVGKMDERGAPLLPSHGEIDPVVVARVVASRIGADDVIAARLRLVEARETSSPRTSPALAREAYFCSGCPHSVSTRVPEGSQALTGIGCHMMVVGMDRDTSTFTQMGGEGVGWIGMSPFTTQTHMFVNMGDGTYFHSGVLAIRAAIAAKVNATYKILFNDAVAMTGGQPHDGELTVPDVARQMLAEGAQEVVVVAEEPERLAGRLPRGVRLFPRDELDAVQRCLREQRGVTILIYDQVCAAEKRRRRKRGQHRQPERRAFINDLVCEGCGDCSAVSNCISIEPHETEFGRKRRINQSSCNTDLSCINGFCPSFVTIEGGRLRRPEAQAPPADSMVRLPTPTCAPLDRIRNLLLAGVGGTGVVTISAILAMAAHLDGGAALALDQTGLAQKNGSVMSHLRIGPRVSRFGPPRIGLGETDLLLGFDMNVAGSPAALATLAPNQSFALIDSQVTPTAAFMRDGAVDFRAAATLRAIARAAGEDRSRVLPAARLAEALLGDAIAGNMLLLGCAWQEGLIPLSLGAIERAIELNGTAAGMNKNAFAWGRLAAFDLAAVEAAAAIAQDDKAGGPQHDLDAIVARHAEFLTAYQDAAYADRYRRLVAAAQRAEAMRAPGRSGFAEAVARCGFKLMAVKDEYEVARLHVDAAFRAKIDRQFEPGYRLQFHFAPPLFARVNERTGAPAKIAFGPWVLPLLRLLAKLKSLRGGAFDIFGRSAERRMERALASDYIGLMRRLFDELTPENHGVATALASLPEDIRGFGHVKAASIERALKKQVELIAHLETPRTAEAR